MPTPDTIDSSGLGVFGNGRARLSGPVAVLPSPLFCFFPFRADVDVSGWTGEWEEGSLTPLHDFSHETRAIGFPSSLLLCRCRYTLDYVKAAE